MIAVNAATPVLVPEPPTNPDADEDRRIQKPRPYLVPPPATNPSTPQKKFKWAAALPCMWPIILLTNHKY